MTLRHCSFRKLLKQPVASPPLDSYNWQGAGFAKSGVVAKVSSAPDPKPTFGAALTLQRASRMTEGLQSVDLCTIMSCIASHPHS